MTAIKVKHGDDNVMIWGCFGELTGCRLRPFVEVELSSDKPTVIMTD